MPWPIQVFVCHKKLLEHDQENLKASILYDALKSAPDRYDPWMDESIHAGAQWERTIYDKLMRSEVLLVAVGPTTRKSEWVKREISLATALNISVVPLGYDMTLDQLTAEQEELGIRYVQGKLSSNIRLATKDILLREIGRDLEEAREKTHRLRDEVLTMLSLRSAPKAKDEQSVFSVKVDVGDSVLNIHVASGDFTRTRNIDVLVNSENDHMQMARAFEVRTMSSLLRTRGSVTSGGRFADVIQRELDWQLGDRLRPVQAAEVFVTSAGGPDSRLSKENKARYIFHVASVQVVAAAAKVVPFKQPSQIEDCVYTSLSKLSELNSAQGIVSPPGTPQRAAQEELARRGQGISRSILFPLFGTGQGGASTVETIAPMISGLQRFLGDPDNQAALKELTDIYFVAYREPDVPTMRDELQRAFGQTS